MEIDPVVNAAPMNSKPCGKPLATHREKRDIMKIDTVTKTATPIAHRQKSKHNGDEQVMYRCDPPYCGNEYIVSSAITLGTEMQSIDQAFRMLGQTMGMDPGDPRMDHRTEETYLFACDEDGKIQDYGQLPGSLKDVRDVEEPLKRAGYHIVNPNQVLN